MIISESGHLHLNSSPNFIPDPYPLRHRKSWASSRYVPRSKPNRVCMNRVYPILEILKKIGYRVSGIRYGPGTDLCSDPLQVWHHAITWFGVGQLEYHPNHLWTRCPLGQPQTRHVVQERRETAAGNSGYKIITLYSSSIIHVISLFRLPS